MTNKYEKALIALSEILLEKENALQWKETQLELRDKEIENLKTKLTYIEQYADKGKKE